MDAPTPSEKELREMPYNDLRKYAVKFGVKGKKLKAEKVIKSILSNSLAADDSFLLLEQQIMNSSTKNKLSMFEEDRKQQLSNPSTPRRETYSIDSPFNSVAGGDIQGANSTSRRETFSMDSPFLPQAVSETKKSSSNSKGTPVKNEAELKTEMTGKASSSKRSARKSNKVVKQKVGFVTPARSSPSMNPTSSGTKYISVRDRPKTPVPSRDSLRRSVTFQTPKSVTPRKKTSQGGLKSRRSTPYRLQPNSQKKVIASGNLSSKRKKSTTPKGTPAKTRNSSTPKNTPVMKKRFLTPKLSSVKKQSYPKSIPTPTPNAVTTITPGNKRKDTPNFQKIHQKAFEKMESIDEYQKRKLQFSAKRVMPPSSATKRKLPPTRIPQPFGGIPFIPSVTEMRNVKMNFAAKCEKPGYTPIAKNTRLRKLGAEEEKKVGHAKIFTAEAKPKQVLPPVKIEEIKPLRKNKFDLKASLARKLPYKPHTGALKPLSESRFNMKPTPTSNLRNPKAKNTVVELTSRIKSRVIVQGVRMNRRFELQMSNRKM